MPLTARLLLPLEGLAAGVGPGADSGLAALRHVVPGADLGPLDCLACQLLPQLLKRCCSSSIEFPFLVSLVILVTVHTRFTVVAIILEILTLELVEIGFPLKDIFRSFIYFLKESGGSSWPALTALSWRTLFMKSSSTRFLVSRFSKTAEKDRCLVMIPLRFAGP